MIRETIVPAIPDLRGDNLKDVVSALKSTLDVREGRVGDPLDQLVTLRELTALNLAVGGGTTTLASGGSLPVSAMLPPVVSGYNPATDFTTPPAPSGLIAKGGFTNVYLSWNGAPYRNHSYTEIWRAAVDDLAQASLIGTTAASVYADPATPDSTYFYWIRFVSKAAVTGPYNQTSGTPATTALDVSAALNALSNELQSSQLFVDLGQRVERIETDAYIQNLTSGAYKSQLDQLSSATTSINSQITSLRAVNSNTATLLTDLRTRSGKQPMTFFQDAAPASNANYTLAIDDIWYDTNDSNKRYRWGGTAWQEAPLTVAVYRQPVAPVNSLLAPLNVGDLWYDSDDNNRAYSWTGAAWAETVNAYAEALVTSLEQTKIGYATLNATGLVFDNDGAITNKADVDAWNTANPGNLATWHVGLPLASAVKQVGVTDGNDTLTLEQRFIAQKSTNDQLYGQYTVKIDNKGHVSGFGLASGTVNGTPSSAFIVRADRFGIAGVNDDNDPLGTLAPTSKPFMVLTAPTTVNGKIYPAGTWIDTAFIANATITNAQITDLTADKITAGTVTAALGVSTGKLWGGVAVSSSPATFGNLLEPFASANFGTGFFLGNDGGAYKFYVGSPTQNMNWNGSALTVTGNLNAVSGSFRNITVYDANDNVILSSGGVNTALLGLGSLAFSSSVDYSTGVSGSKPPVDATRNVVTYGASAPSNPVNGDVWVDTSASPYVIKVRVSGGWQVSSNYTTNTNQLDDGAQLGQTATWTSVAGRPTTLAALDATAASDLDGKTVTYYQAAAPVGTVNDLWFDTDDGNKLYRHNGTSWVVVQDAGIAAAAGLASQAQATADYKVTTFYSTSAPASPSTGDLWYNPSTRALQRWSGSAWVTSGNYVDNTNQLDDGAQLGQTANWTQVANRPTTLAALDAVAASDLDGKTITYYQASPPAGTVNDLWFDTDDGNKLYRHDGSAWVVVQDAGIAAAAGLATIAKNTADSKITTFYSTSAPSNPAVGDLWYNSSTRLLQRWSGSTWMSSGNYVDNTNQLDDGAQLGQTANWTQVANRPTTLAALDATAAADLDGKTVTFYQASPPAGTINDLWFDTDDGNKLYRHNGTSWVVVQDAGIAAAAGLATIAKNTADYKVTTFYAASAPTATAVGDLWYNTSTRELLRWNGSAWNTSATHNTVYRQATAPTGASVNDLWFNTSTAAVYYWNGSSWILAGDVTSQNQAASIANQGALATADSVFIGSTVKIYNSSTSSYETLNTGDFVNRLTKIGTGNISSFISDAAIGDAYIGNLNAAKITAGTIAADRLDSAIITGKVANLDAAVITNGFINSARIGTAAIDTLKIAGNAVTIPLTYETSSYYTSTGTVLTYNFNMPYGGKVIIFWQGQTDSARNFFFRIYLNTVPGGGSSPGFVYVGYPNGDYIYDVDINSYTYVGTGNGDYNYDPGTPMTPDIGNTRTGGAFEDAPTAIGFGTAVAGNNTVRIYWQRDQGALTYQRLIILGAQR